METINFSNLDIAPLASTLGRTLETIYRPATGRVIPSETQVTSILPEEGVGAEALPGLWQEIVERSTRLAEPTMLGHMDTAPHPVAALTDCVVSALNNNLLFRELSPFASQIEEGLIEAFAQRLGLPVSSTGTFCSGGSIANLTALFVACGGFENIESRDRVRLHVSECHHASVMKAAAVLGIPKAHILVMPGDDTGRCQPSALDEQLSRHAGLHNIVAVVAGSTIHGAIDPLAEIGAICRRHDAWFHVDAIYGGALCFSGQHRHHLAGVDVADSVVIGPQKWMYVPRVCAVVLFRAGAEHDARFGVSLPYSVTGAAHRGQWGLQGSRRADALTLWTLLQVIGTRALGLQIDSAMALTEAFHGRLVDRMMTEPAHRPELNLQCFSLNGVTAEDKITARHRRMTTDAPGWFSLSRWRDRLYFRAVLLPPETTLTQLDELLSALCDS